MIYDVYVDESGLFTETSSDPGDRIVEHKRSRKFPSQLAGLIVPEGTLSADDAWDLFEPACEQAGVTVGEEFHSTEIKRWGGGIFDRLVIETCRCLAHAKIQPFRIVNRERVSFGDRKANYVNVLGELLVRICKQIDRGEETLTLNVFQAGVKNSEFEEGNLPFWEHADFIPTLRTVFQRAAIAAGWAKDSAKWRLGDFRFRSGKRDERLWLCDLVSNASHDEFATISPDAATALQTALGEFDFTLSFNSTMEQVKQLSDRRAYGVAVVELAEHIISPWTSQEAKSSYARAFDEISSNLISLSPLAREPQFRTILGWLNQTADDRERLEDAKSACKLIQTKFVEKHKSELAEKDSTLAPWLQLGIATAALTACNHSGDLDGGRAQSELIDRQVPDLAGRWEYASDLMRAMVVQAVQLNDRFEHHQVCQKMDLVADYYQTLGGLFQDAYKDVFPESIQSKVCGEALGTKLQSQVFLLLKGDAAIDDVRETSDQAMEQFADQDNLQRQFQYRSEVEAIAGQWKSAREFVGKGIGATSFSHSDLARFIADLEPSDQGFPLLHWTRIGGMAAAAGDQTELDSFHNAWKSTSLDRTQWAQGEFGYYPAHGVLRRLASVYAGVGDDSKVIETLRIIRGLVKPGQGFLFQLIETAALLQAAGIAGRKDPELMQRILCGSKNDPPVTVLLEKIQSTAVSTQPKIAQIASEWLELVADDPKPDMLVSAAAIIAY